MNIPFCDVHKSDQWETEGFGVCSFLGFLLLQHPHQPHCSYEHSILSYAQIWPMGNGGFVACIFRILTASTPPRINQSPIPFCIVHKSDHWRSRVWVHRWNPSSSILTAPTSTTAIHLWQANHPEALAVNIPFFAVHKSDQWQTGVWGSSCCNPFSWVLAAIPHWQANQTMYLAMSIPFCPVYNSDQWESEGFGVCSFLFLGFLLLQHPHQPTL